MYPHERSLVEKYQGKPFVLLGVNTDEDRERARKAVATKSLNWRSWFAGGTDGDIPRQWAVESYPTLHIIDANGVIRHRDVCPGPGVERAIESLLKEMQ